jgi:transketolase
LSTGSLGHGLPVSVGMAIAAKRDKKKWRVFCLLSDGELDEGSNWEAILFAPHHNIDNLVVIIDYNKIQSLDETNKTLNIEPLKKKFLAFNWAVQEINGHNFAQIENALQTTPFKKCVPSCIIAHTIKGKGVSFMENTVLWHYKNPSGEGLKKALEELQQNA